MYTFYIAMRHISSKKKQTFFSLLAVVLAVATIITLMSMVTGFQEELVSMTIENSPDIVIKSQDSEEEYLHLYSHLEETILNIPGVSATSSIFKGQAALQNKDNAEGILLIGIDPEAENAVVNLRDDVTEGNFESLSRTGSGIMIGDKLAEDLEVRCGDRVDVIFPGVRARSLEVVAIIDTGTPADDTNAYARLETVQDFYNEKGVITSINVRVEDPYAAESIALLIEDSIKVDAKSWIETNEEILELLNTQMIFVWVFYALIYVIAGFGIANILITIVMDKKKEIGMLMAMGVSKKSITRIFLIESTLLGALGVIAGCIVGYISSVAIGTYEFQIPSEMYFGMTSLPMKIDPMNFIYASIFTFTLNILAGVYPARRAANLDPVEAIEN